MVNIITPVDLNNPADWNRFAPDDLVKNSQLAEFLGVALHVINNKRDLMPKIHLHGKPILYIGSEITRWMNVPENRELVKRYRKTEVRLEPMKEAHVSVLNQMHPKFSISCTNNCFIITIPFNDFPMSQLQGLIPHFA